MIDAKIIAVDFDGTLCEDRWPEIGEPNQEVIDYVKSEPKSFSGLIELDGLYPTRLYGVMITD